jgi:oligoribonuclease NrnB/cAMP/cGMP phosphodiesterase (DHH superfamily)
MTAKVCLYHGSDLDGHCSGAIYAKAHKGEEFTLHPIDYGDPVPWDLVAGADVTLIDFTIQPADAFADLMIKAKSTTWIDHHRSAINEWKNREVPCPGVTMVLNEKKAGCELAWEHYFLGQEPPIGVQLLGRYDVWDHADERTLPYQYGMRLHDLDPASGKERDLWEDVLATDGSDDVITSEMIQHGAILLLYQEQNDAAAVVKSCFDLSFAGKRWIACNRLGKGSRFFSAVWNQSAYDGMLSFGWDGSKWIIGMYSDRSDIDCGAIAKDNGGGGHPGAAGFQCAELPFNIKGDVP